MLSALSTTFPSFLQLHLHRSPLLQPPMRTQSSPSLSIPLAIFSARDQKTLQQDSGVVRDRRADKNSINGILPRKALPRKNWSVSRSVNGGRTRFLPTLQMLQSVAAAAAISSKSLCPACPTSLLLLTASSPARRR